MNSASRKPPFAARASSRKKVVPNPEGIGGKSHKIVNGQCDQQQTKQLTSEKVADEFGVSEATVRRAGKFAEGAPKGNKNAGKQSPQNEDIESKRTCEAVAEDFGVSRATVERAGKFAEEVNEDPELKQTVLEGKNAKKQSGQNEHFDSEKTADKMEAVVDAIDGRHRVKACGELGRSVDARVYHGDGDAVMAFVVSLNLKRRHLSESQRGMVGARLANLGKGRPRENAQICALSQPDVAEQLQVSRRSIQNAVAVQRTGTPELQQAVWDGKASTSAAADVATLPEEEQREVVAAGPKAVQETAKEIRAAKRPHVANNSGEMEWYTPPYIIERARQVLCPLWVKCVFFSKRRFRPIFCLTNGCLFGTLPT